MKLSVLALTMASAAAFSPATFVRRTRTTEKTVMHSSNFDLSGNSWQPDSEKMGSTDTGDYFPEGYDPEAEIAFTSGMMGSQSGGRDNDGPELPGMENLGADAVMMGGIEMSSEIPAGMEFIPSSVPDGEITMQVSANGSGDSVVIDVKPVCMTFEDYFAAFAPASSHPSFSVSPVTGRMDRRGGEPTQLQITCNPQGASGDLTGDLVINLPEDNSKICYKVTAKSF